eukprot:TRINITY_DN4257_c0_g1_i1.p1 TRINITY_DN4257_c0_g1~~TRINITY_DN4257_c0_g1_i1.p1  ORF type:complete len:292 (+),score=36.03 TRINITY_DN4257_c0_g1_i1:1-876(+)
MERHEFSQGILRQDDSDDDDIGFFGYEPNTPASIFSLIVFAVIGVALLGLIIRFRTWYLAVLPFACAMEVFSFAWRIYIADHLNEKPAFICSYVAVLLAPTIIAAADYAIVARMMVLAGIPQIFRIFKPNVVRYVFLAGDLLAFAIQGVGGALLSSSDTPEGMKRGSQIILGGLAVSLAIFVFFLVLAIFIRATASGKDVPKDEDQRWRRLLPMLYLHMVLFLIRSCYRLAEYSFEGFHNRVSTNEGLFYGCDVALMMVIMITWIPFFPGFHGIEERKTKNKVELAIVAAP